MKEHSGIIITGANGYIGGHCVRYFANLGYSVLALVSNKNEPDTQKIKHLYYEEFYTADLSNYNCLLHCSWNGVTHKDRQNEEIQKSNYLKSKHIFDYCESQGLKNIIVMGCHAEY